jgi:hypothetical protein
MLKLLISVWYTMNLNNFKTLSDFDVLEFKMQTTAILATWKLIFFFMAMSKAHRPFHFIRVNKGV